MYRTIGKRALDVVAASVALVLCAPILAIAAVVIASTMGRPIFFRQRRPGLRGEPFTLLKFRTMTNAAGPERSILSDGQRITGPGHVLRQTSIDELPELLNVVRGDMSLVGPRPLLERYLDRYTAEQNRRHEVRPGITGWAQVNGRNALSWEQKFQLDVWYVEHLSFWLDVKILLRTIRHTLARRDVVHAGHASMPEFEGSER